ncbi:MAG: hypothetical protein J7K59_06465 [Candidatus Korarchaeota archaeon]|nr:hypothetical protein [Candidatus Korarchaeota archaeon]
MNSSNAKNKLDKQRLDFVRFWVEYIRKTSSDIWSKQQKELIDAMIKSANQNLKEYLRVKMIAKKIAKKLRDEKRAH